MSIHRNQTNEKMIPVAMRVPNSHGIFHFSKLRGPRPGQGQLQPYPRKKLLCLDDKARSHDEMMSNAVEITLYSLALDCWYVKSSDVEALSNSALALDSEPVDAVSEDEAPAYIDLSDMPAFRYWSIDHELSE